MKNTTTALRLLAAGCLSLGLAAICNPVRADDTGSAGNAAANGPTVPAADAVPSKPVITEETPYVTSPMNVVHTMLRMAGVRPDDFLIDLGSGDGRIVITAALENHARGVGMEYDPRLVKLAVENARKAGVSDRATFLEQDIFKADFTQASVITMYLLPQYNLVLQPKLLALKPGTRIVSHDYGIGDWEPDAKEVIPVPEKTVGLKKESAILYWVVPARLAGHWTSPVRTVDGAGTLEFDITQKYQHFEGTATLRGRQYTLDQPYVNGSYVSFRIGQGDGLMIFSANESNGHLAGQVLLANNRNMKWRALKTSAAK